MKDDVLDRFWELVNTVGYEAKRIGTFYFSFAKTDTLMRFAFVEERAGTEKQNTLEIRFPMDGVSVAMLEEIEQQLMMVAKELEHKTIAELGSVMKDFKDAFTS